MPKKIKELLTKNILAIETSCDETAICILRAKQDGSFEILANNVSSQIKTHAPFGGVVPSLAKREHQKNLIPLLTLSLKEAGLLQPRRPKGSGLRPQASEKARTVKEILNRDEILLKKIVPFLKNYAKPNIDLIAVTYGPGLAPALWPGVNLARVLSFYWNIPLKPINHLEAHILANWLKPISAMTNNQETITKKPFPAIALIISGGHTQLVLVKNFGKYKLIGETRDDAVGECFDKTARLLGLPYPGGPAISQQAEKWNSPSYAKAMEDKQFPITNKRVKYKIPTTKYQMHLPRPMINSNDFDFSFSGLKTAVLYLVQNLKEQKVNIKKITPELCFEFQKTINDVLISKTLKSAQKFKAKSIILGGGVSANQSLKDAFEQKIKKEMPDVQFISPERKYSTDNAAMIAITALINKKQKNIAWQKLQANANLRLKEIK